MATLDDRRYRLVSMSALAMLAIVGVLFMHGLDAAAVEFVDTGHHTAPDETGRTAAVHGAIGLCVFVMTAAGLIAAGVLRLPRRRPVPDPRCLAPIIHSIPAQGRLRLFALCVMRA
jgi:hypothetical protein